MTSDGGDHRSEEHTSKLQSLRHLVCRLLLEKKNVATPSAKISVPAKNHTFTLLVLKTCSCSLELNREASQTSSVDLSFGGCMRTETYYAMRLLVPAALCTQMRAVSTLSPGGGCTVVADVKLPLRAGGPCTRAPHMLHGPVTTLYDPLLFFFQSPGDHPDLHSFPTRRSSD